jgi:hypothetical protein
LPSVIFLWEEAVEDGGASRLGAGVPS